MNIALFCGYFLIAVVIGFFLWQTLFASKGHHAKQNAQATHSEQKSANKDSVWTSAAPAHTNPTEEAIAKYTLWVAIFTASLVVATIALFISGERNVQVASRSADAAKDSVEVASKTLVLSQRPWISVTKIDNLDVIDPRPC